LLHDGSGTIPAEETPMTRGYARIYDWKEDDVEVAVCLSKHLRIRLTDLDRNPLPFAKCRTVDDKEAVFECDKDGVATIPWSCSKQGQLELEWEPEEAGANADEDRFFFRAKLLIGIESVDEPQCSSRLANLAFAGGSLNQQVAAFQTLFDRDATGELAGIRDELASWHDGGTYPGQVMVDEDIQDVEENTAAAENTTDQSDETA
jgi:hypothetical protein